ncbi:MAG: hypothetical protein AAGF71_14250, partial [Pseudomonadota bacterium]
MKDQSSQDEAADIYGIGAWGQGLVHVLPDGSAALNDPLSPDKPSVSLPQVVQDLSDRGIATPILLRVQSCFVQGLVYRKIALQKPRG